MALPTACQTPDAVFSIKITDRYVAVRVDFPRSLRLTEHEAELLEANLHNAVELALARCYTVKVSRGRILDCVTRTERVIRAAFAGLCTYEAVALTTGRVPTVSVMCHGRRKLQIALIAVLLAHLNLARQVAEAAGEAVEETAEKLEEAA